MPVTPALLLRFLRHFHPLPLQLLVGLVDGAEQLLEARSILDGPEPVEGRAEKLQVTPGEQRDGDDALLVHVVENARLAAKCLLTAMY